jgi:caspase domain-containing protein/Sel1 repeat-containing protein
MAGLALALAAVFVGRSQAASDAVDADKLIVVDCLLPGKVIRTGGKMTYLSQRRPARLAASECEIRGGEYVVYDRANYSTALRVWQPMAESGDAQAQVYVGEIYEKGMGVPPDYAAAAVWYEKAAKQGFPQGLNHAAYLYEQGLGVAKDPVRALNLYRQAAGLKSDELTFVSEIDAVRRDSQAQIDALSLQLEERDQNAAQIAKTLDETRRRLKDQQALVQRATHDAETMRNRVQQLNTAPQSATNTQELSRVKSELTDREAKLAAQNAEIAQLQRSSSEQSDALRTRLAEADKEETALRQQLGAAQAQLHGDELQLAASKVQAQTIDQDAQQLRAQVKSGTDALQAAQQQLQSKQAAQGAQGEADRQRTDQLKATVAQQQVQLERQRTVIASLDAQREKLDADSHRLQAAIDSWHQQHDRDASSAAQTMDTSVALRGRLAAAQNDLLRKTQEEADLAAKLDASMQQINLANKSLNTSAAVAGSKDNEIRRLNSELAKQEAAASEQRSQLAALRATVTTDAQTLKELHQKVDDLNKHPPLVAASPVSASAILAPEFAMGQFHALIIGNSNYAHMAALPSAQKDADAVERVLSERYAFKGRIRKLIDSNRDQMINALYEAVKSVGEQDSLLIYYVGHGALEESSRHSYWLPIDADNNSPGKWVSDRDITSWVAETKAKHVLIIADSCYAGAMSHGTSAQIVSNGTANADKKRMLLLAKLPSRTVLTSGGIEPVLDSGPDVHSIFAHEFVELLDANSQVIETTSLYASLADRVRVSAMRVGAITGMPVSQVPQISWLGDAGHESGGEFLFVPTATTRSAALSVATSPFSEVLEGE